MHKPFTAELQVYFNSAVQNQNMHFLNSNVVLILMITDQEGLTNKLYEAVNKVEFKDQGVAKLSHDSL